MSTRKYFASSGRRWPAWVEEPHQGGEGSDLLPFLFTPGLDLTSQHSLPGWCDDDYKFEEEGHKMEEVDDSVRGGVGVSAQALAQ